MFEKKLDKRVCHWKELDPFFSNREEGHHLVRKVYVCKTEPKSEVLRQTEDRHNRS